MRYNVKKMKYEYKYLVPKNRLSELRRYINPFLIMDGYIDRGGPCDCLGGPFGYTVRSIYFDTPGYQFFHEKIEGIKKRKKVRIRGYNEYNHDNTVFLEIKRKNEKRIFKNRSAIKFSDLGNLLLTGNVEKYILTNKKFEAPIEDAQQFLFNIQKNRLLPVVLVIYEREAFFGKLDNSVRITFDNNLRSTIYPDIHKLYKEERIKYSIPHHFVLEVKFFDGFPSWMSKIVGSMNLKLKSFSKYTTCIDEHLVIRTTRRELRQNIIKSVRI